MKLASAVFVGEVTGQDRGGDGSVEASRQEQSLRAPAPGYVAAVVLVDADDGEAEVGHHQTGGE